MSEHFERWKELAALCLQEQDPSKLMVLANEMNLALKTHKTSYVDPVQETLESHSLTPALGPKKEVCNFEQTAELR